MRFCSWGEVCNSYKVYYRDAHGALVLYDATNPSSFHIIEKCIAGTKEFAFPDCQIFLLGNKADQEDSYCQTVLFGHKADDEESRKVSFAAGSELASKLGLPFFEGSAKLGSDVYEAFDKLTALMVAKAIEDKRDTKIRFRKKDASKDEKRGCAVF